MKEFADLVNLEFCFFPGIGNMETGKNGVTGIYKTNDGKAIFLVRENNVLTYLPTRVGIPTYYPLQSVTLPEKIKAVLMDLDGTSVRTEQFWIWVIEQTTARLLNRTDFKFTEEDFPHVSGASVSEHLKYAINKYCQAIPHATLENAWKIYFEITNKEMDALMQGKGKEDAFKPAPFLKEFLVNLKDKGIKIGLVSSGLYNKAWPEIKSAFKTLELGDPAEFYDAIVTAGYSIKKGQPGTLGELQAKPHPWPYAECLHALSVDKSEAIGIEDSGAGVLSVRLAGIPAIGISGGNIESGGEKPLCVLYLKDLREVWEQIKNRLS